MKSFLLRLVSVSGVALGLAASPGCTSSSSPSAATTSFKATTARIKGSVLASANAGVTRASFQALSAATGAGINVSLVGTNLSTQTDSHGHFTLDNAPAGSRTLHFEGNGANGNLGVDLHEGVELHITVRVNGPDVNLECKEEIEEPDGANNDGAHESATKSKCDQGDVDDGDHAGDQAETGTK